MARPGADLVFRPLTRADFPQLVEWLARPHVEAWWGTPLDLAGVERDFGRCIDRIDPTEMFLCAEARVPLGLVQIYRLADNPDYQRAVEVEDGAGIDLFIGEPDRCGHGVGPRLIGHALELVWDHYPEVRRAMAGPSVRNTRSHRAFEKAGFRAVRRTSVPGEEDDELIMVCPRPAAARATAT